MKFDVLIKDGFIVDGTGGAWYRADVGVEDDKITEVCKNLPNSGADRVIDAKGLVVCPGFFDMHTHGELHYFKNPRWEAKIMQGVTTDFNGHCGVTPSGPLKGIEFEGEGYGVRRKARELDLPVEVDWTTLAEYMDRLESFGGVSVNSAYMVGFGTVRRGVLGWENRPPTRDEMDEMKAMVAGAMEDGAFGLSTGLQYPPQNFAETDEVVELAKVVAEYGGIHTAHIRRHGHLSDPRGGRAFLTPIKDTMLEAVRECIEIGERAGIPTVWSHAKIIGSWKLAEGLAEEFLREVDNARRRGVDVTLDQWADPTKGGGAKQIFPLWAFEGGFEKVRERLRDPVARSKIRNIVKENLEGMSPMIDFRNAIIIKVNLEKNRDLVGKTLGDAAKIRSKEMVDLYLDMVMENDRPNVVGRTSTDEDIITMLKHPAVLFGTDGGDRFPKEPVVGYMRGFYGLYPMVLRKYVKEMRVIKLEEAIRKMTSASANKLGIMDRGLIRPGMWADLVVFDPLNIREPEGSGQPKGIFYILVNGCITVDNGEHTGARAGKILKHKYYPKR